ncbi:hypothetical protein [Methylobacterium nigriterrae]|uniref:hypothetical protein n=1 Tax=Methylobacterium nigriterrae TaxID=3127512 RepID=UPI00301388B0
MSAGPVRGEGRRALLAAGAGVGLLLLSGLALGWRAAMTSYLAAWLVLLALPVGALPLVVLLQRFGGGRCPFLLAGLRRLLSLMPVALLLALPLLASVWTLYPWAQGAQPATPLGKAWFTPVFFVARLIAYGAAWFWLALRLVAQAGTDDRTAILGCFLHAIVGTLAAQDLVMSLDHRLGSSLAGLLLMSAWSGLALAAAILLSPARGEAVGDGDASLTMLAVLTAAWAFLHFLQVFIVWSANLPDEVLWYFARGGLFGRALSVLGGLVAVGAALLTLRPGGSVRLVAGAAVALHGAEMFWFVTPAARDRFGIAWTDVLALLAIGCLSAALLPISARLMPRAAAAGREVDAVSAPT